MLDTSSIHGSVHAACESKIGSLNSIHGSQLFKNDRFNAIFLFLKDYSILFLVLILLVGSCINTIGWVRSFLSIAGPARFQLVFVICSRYSVIWLPRDLQLPGSILYL